MKVLYKLSVLLVFAVTFTSCFFDDLPVDEDGLLITSRAECYVSNFELLGVDYVTVRANSPRDLNNFKPVIIDTTACTIEVEVKWGTDLKNLYPRFTLASDCKLDPKIPGITDFSDLAHPRQYTVISGNRKVRKTYTVYVSVQELN